MPLALKRAISTTCDAVAIGACNEIRKLVLQFIFHLKLLSIRN